MFTKRNFPINISIPKDIDFWIGLKFEEISFEKILRLRLLTKTKAILTLSIQSESVGLFDLSTQFDSKEVFVDGRKFLTAVSATNIFKGFDLELDQKEVRIITSKTSKKIPTIAEIPLPKKTYPRVLLEDHKIARPEDFKEISLLSSIHKSCQDVVLTHFLTNSHITFDKTAIRFWSTFGGAWHMINIPYAQEDEFVSECDASFAIRPHWFKNMPIIPEINYVSIRMDSGNNPYLFLSNGQNGDSLIIPTEKDGCTVDFPEVSNHPQNKLPISRSIKLSERDRKIILKNLDAQSYFVLI